LAFGGSAGPFLAAVFTINSELVEGLQIFKKDFSSTMPGV